MPNVYVYDETRVDYFVTSDLGLVAQSVTETIDYGNISAQADPPEFDELQFNVNDYGFVSRTGTVLPFGTVTVSGTISRKRVFTPATTGLGILSGTAKKSFTRSTWIGSGTLFEIGGGLERLVIPDFGAAGPSPRIIGNAFERTRDNYVGSAVNISVSSSAQTREFNVYPVSSTITISVTGGTSQEYPNEYIQSIVQEQLVGKAQEKIAYQYALTEVLPFDEEDWGILSDVNGDSFDKSAVTFDSTITQNSAFSDAVVVETEDWGIITQASTGPDEDYDTIATSATNKFGKIQTSKYLNAEYKKSFDYSGSGSISVSTAVVSTDRVRSFAGSGSILLNGQLGLGQAPQHTIFGLGDKIVLSGTCAQSFVPRPVKGSGITIFSSGSSYRRISNPPERKAELLLYGYVDKVNVIFKPARNTIRFNISGQATKLQVFKSYKGSDKLKFSGALSTKDIRFAPHWRSPLERDGFIEPIDYGFVNELPTEPNDDWGWVNEVPLSINGGGSLDFGYIIPIFTRINIVGIGANAFVRNGYQGSGSINLSGKGLIPTNYKFRSTGLSGIATHPAGFFFSGANWFSQAPQHTVFGVGDYIVVSGTGNEAIIPAPETGSGVITLSGAYANLKFTSGAGEQTILTTISGTGNERFIPNFNGSGTITLRQGREVGQTYYRIIVENPTRPAVLFSIYNNTSIFEKNTESYNTSSIYKGGDGSEDYGTLGSSPSYGFDLSYQGTGSGALTATFDDESNTYDQDIISGSRYSDDLLGTGLLPTFDKTSQYEVDFSSVNVTEDYGNLDDNTPGGFVYNQYLYPYYTGFSDQDGIDKGYEDLGFLTENPNEPAKYPFGTILFQQPTFANISRIIPKYPGKGTLVVSGTAEEKFATGDSSAQLFAIGGSANEAYSAQSPENTQLFEISGTRESESATFVEIGSGSINISGQLIERTTFSEVGTGIITFSGASVERTNLDPLEQTILFNIYGSYSNLQAAFVPPSIKATIRLSGNLVHPFIDYTPHYGIERNVGIETGIFILPGGAGGEYGNPGIVTTRFTPQYPGGYAGGGTAGPIKLSDKAISRTNAPITTDGTIYILGIGTAANGELDGVEIGATWKFTPQPVRGGPGLISIKGIGITREIQIYQYYGDLRNPGTSGTIVISTEKKKTEERNTFRIVSSGGAISVSGTATERKTKSFRGSGRLFVLSDGSKSRSKSYVSSGSIQISGSARKSLTTNPPEDTILYSISGSAKKSVRLTTDFGGVIRISGSVGNIGDPITTKSFRGSGRFNSLSGSSWSFTRKSRTNTVLVQVSGISSTRKIQSFGYYGDLKNPGTSGVITISGALSHPQIDYTPAYKSSGLFRILGSAGLKSSLAAVGIGKVTISGQTIQKFTYQGSEQTVLFNISGTAKTRELNVYQDFITSGLFRISGISATREIQVYGYYGDQKNPGTSGVITISGRPLVHPDVRYIPSPDGSGTIFITGTGTRSRTYPLYQGSGVLFTFSSGKESYTRSTYVGIGNVILSSSGITEILRYEEPRTYVVII